MKMNPSAALVIMEKSIEQEEWDTLRFYAERLREWIAQGGRAPEWKTCPNAHAYYLGRFGSSGGGTCK